MESSNARKLGLAAFVALTGAAALPLSVSAQSAREGATTLEAAEPATEAVLEEGSGEGSGEVQLRQVREAEAKRRETRDREREMSMKQ